MLGTALSLFPRVKPESVWNCRVNVVKGKAASTYSRSTIYIRFLTVQAFHTYMRDRLIAPLTRVETTRLSAQMILQHDCEFTGVRWNPRMDNLFATSDNQGRVCLRDTRTSFGSTSNRTRQPLEQVRPLLWR